MLTKSDLQSYLQCPRKLWLERNQPDLKDRDDSAARRRIFDGNVVGEKARAQLGDGFLWPPAKEDPFAAAEAARELLEQAPESAAAEVPLLRAGVYARADALVPKEGKYILRETKASTFPLKKDKVTPGSPEECHLNDVAIQAWVMSGSSLQMTGCELNLLDNRWRYPGNGDYSGLFRQMEVSSEIAKRLDSVQSWVEQAEAALNGGMPDQRIGKHCGAPYECQFQSYCGALEPMLEEHPIELLPDKPGKDLARKLRETKGYVSLLEPKPEEFTGKQADLYRRIQRAHRSGQGILEPGTVQIMRGLPYPRYFFDFEGVNLPVPRWIGVRPYEQIPFQWSCHIERAAGVFDHAEFLDLSGNDPSIPCIEMMRQTIDSDDSGPILVYHATYERGRLEGLAERHPNYAGLLKGYASRLVDLLPIVKQHFYHPAMKGSFSIKKVLAVIAPDLSYAKLEGVQEGTGAQLGYIDVALDQSVSTERKHTIDQQLRSYCRQDTWAMVEVAYFLAQAGKPTRPTE